MVDPSDSTPAPAVRERDDTPTRAQPPRRFEKDEVAGETTAADSPWVEPTVDLSKPGNILVEDAEVAERVERKDDKSPSVPSGTQPLPTTHSAGTTIASPVDALRHDEIRRSRLLARAGMLLPTAVAGTTLLFDSSPFMDLLLMGGLLLIMAVNVWLLYLSRDPTRYVAWKVRLIWTLATVGISIAIIYFGTFSPAPMVLVLGIYFVSLGTDFRAALLCYATSVVFQVGAGVIFAFEIVADPGVVHANYRSVGERLAAVLMVQMVMLAVFLLARSQHRTTVRSMTEFDSAVRAIAQREALLHEAKQDLERALQLGGAGRFTGQCLGSYRLGNVIGRGAMGEVYEAARRDSGEIAAVKLLQPAMLGNPGYVKRFLREVEIASSLEVEHVVKVLEVSDPKAPFPYLVMEYLQGRDLADILRMERKLSPGRVLELIEQVGRGLHTAAQAGIVHRDLKPQNLFLSRRTGGGEIWKILDFGVSKLSQTSGTLTQGNLIGTPIYMAPEQASGKNVDHRADLYALAAIAYRCLTGHLPFRAKDVPAILYKVVHKMPQRPSALADNLHEDVDAVMTLAMAKQPRERFETAEELRVALDSAFRGELDDSLRRRATRVQRRWPWHNS